MEYSGELQEHYEKLLGVVSPWEIESVDLDVKGRKVDIGLAHRAELPVACPICGKECPRKDHTALRTWRHLDTMQFQTLLHARIPRSQCPEHGVLTIRVPWSEPQSHFTLLFVRFAIDVIRACGNLTDACGLLGLSWDEASLIQSKAVERGLKRRPRRGLTLLGMDEKRYRKDRHFATILNDLVRQCVIDIADTKSAEAADTLLQGLKPAQRQSVQAVAIDMAEVYVKAIARNLPDAAIVHDKFHITQYLNAAVEKVWSAENRSLGKQGDKSLAGSRFLWLYNPDNLNAERKARLDELRRGAYRVGRAWQFREQFREFWIQPSKTDAAEFFKHWYFRATHSRLKPIIQVAKMLKRHLHNLLNYIDHRITNAGSESINGRVQSIIARAKGFRNFGNFRYTILFHLGDLALYPQ